MLDSIKALKAAGRFPEVNAGVPYAGFVGLRTVVEGDRIVTVLPASDDVIGNPHPGMVHGGVIGALLEHAAILELLWSLELDVLPKIVNISIDFLRPALREDTHARGNIVRQGRRIANVRVEAWQSDPARPVAAAHAHFLLAGDR